MINLASARWFLEAANKGHADAQYKSGWYYELGVGVAQDNAAAYKWYRLSASQGNDPARDALENLLEKMSEDQITKALELFESVDD